MFVNNDGLSMINILCVYRLRIMRVEKRMIATFKILDVGSLKNSIVSP